MKRIIYLYILVFPFFAMGQDQDKNYVKTSVYREATATRDTTKTHASVTYYDGLGRPVQQVAGSASATGKDIVTHIEYEQQKRQAKAYLPYPSTTTDLSFNDGAKAATELYYSTATGMEHTANPYTRTIYDNSPFNRVMKTAAPGNAWAADTVGSNDHTIKYAYLLNTANDAVKKLSASARWDEPTGRFEVLTFTNSGNYAAGELYKTITQDENKTGAVYNGTSTNIALKLNTVEEYKNKEGQVVLTRIFNYNRPNYETLDTYYIYDQYGNLAFVMPPMAGVSTSNIDLYGYRYIYDKRNRLVEKKLPGRQWEYIVYDTQDRVVATGPAITPFGGTDTTTGWIINNYDIFGRVAYTGWRAQTGFSSVVRKTMQENAFTVVSRTTSTTTIDGKAFYYNNPNASFLSGMKLLSVNYYDDYLWLDTGSRPTSSTQVEGENAALNCKGLATGSWVRVLDPATTAVAKGETTYTYYDKKAKPIRTRTINYLGGYTQADIKMDFDGTAVYTVTKHKPTSDATPAEFTIVENFTYTAQDRLAAHTHKIDNLVAEPLAAFTYNELGQMTQKRVGVTTTRPAKPLQYIDYKYNVRGWLTDINDVDDLTITGQPQDLFAFRIGYDTTVDHSGTTETPLYNGNISETYWRSSSDNTMRKYSYSFDKLNRLSSAIYQKPGGAEPEAHSYDEFVNYDKNGNITSLSRNGGLDDPNLVVEIDNLAYTYTGNQLMKVSELSNSPQGFKNGTNTGNDYTYDAFGNMTTDLNKGISTIIKYNHLNLPVEIVFDGSSTKITYLYNAAGVKIKKSVTDGPGNTVHVDYLGGFQYKGEVLQFFQTSEGYVDNTVTSGGANTYNYVYQYEDHLGNVRMDFAVSTGFGGTGLAMIKEENHYYAFGLKHMNYNMDEYEYQQDIQNNGDVVLLPVVSPSGKLPNNYLYNGKEYQDELGLNMYTMDMRQYDPAIARWVVMDPVIHHSMSPYNAFDNNPVFWADPSGADAYNTAMALFNRSESGVTMYTRKGDNKYFSRIGHIDDEAFKDPYKNKQDKASQEGVGGGGQYSEKGAINNEILNFNTSLLERFNNSGINPFDPVSQVNANDQIKHLIESVQGLFEYWKAAGSPTFNFAGRSSDGYRGFTQDGHMQIYDSAFSSNFWLASTLFHEITHAYQDKYHPNISTDRREAERQAYSTEWRLADQSLRINYSSHYKSVWNNMQLYQKVIPNTIPKYPY